MRRVAAGLLLGVLAVLGVTFLGAATPASAHAALVRTAPVQGSVVPTAPSQIVITFSEHVSAVNGKIKVIGPDGKSIEQGTPQVTGNTLRITVRTDVPRGTYLVSYRVISADSHPVGAGFSYSYGAPSATAANANANAGASGRTDPLVTTGVDVAQFVGFGGLILIAGPALILFALWPKRLDRAGPTRLANIGLAVTAGATVVELYLQAPYSTGSGLFQVTGSGLGDVLTSRYGVAHLIRLGVLGVGALLLRPHLAGRGNQASRGVLVVLGLVAAATWSISGHPGTSTAPALTVVSDVAHLTSVAIWLGGLVVLVLYLLRQANARELGAILPVWSNWATMAVSVLVLAGTAQALVEVGTVGALLHTWYGQVILIKVGVLGLILLVALLSHRLVKREPDTDTVRRLRRTVLAEVAGAVVVLGFAAVLVQATPARTAVANAAGQSATGPYSVTLTSSLYQLQIDVDPVKVGDNELHLYAYTPDGAPLKVVEWKGTASLPAQNVEPITISLLRLTDSHATGQIALPTAGRWQLSFTLRTTDIDEATVSTTINVT